MQRSILYSAKLNNEAASLIRRNRFSEANRLLATALETAKRAQEPPQDAMLVDQQQQEQAQYQQQQQCCSQEELMELSMSACEDYDEHDRVHTAASSLVDSVISCSASKTITADPYIYRRPMTLTAHDMNGTLHEIFSTLSFVIMFNLAISYHLLAMTDGQDSEKRLRSAVKLYELTFQVQGQGLVPHAIVTSAILNNLTLTHKALNHQDKFAACSEMLLSAVLLLIDLGVTSAPPTSEDAANACMVDGFLGNVMHLISNDANVASAA